MNNFKLTPEKIIAAFLEVFENRAEVFEVFSESVSEEDPPRLARDDLPRLDVNIRNLKDRPNQEVADAIRDWCRKYPSIAEVVLDLAWRKPTPKATEPDKQEGILINRYPELPANLRTRINSSVTDNSASE